MPRNEWAAQFADRGYVVLPPAEETLKWVNAARVVADQILSDHDRLRKELRHDQTWFVGVDALPNGADGSLGGKPLIGPWDQIVDSPIYWHPAQLSVVFPRYPGRDAEESDAAHGFRLRRFAAHVDGLLPEGPQRRRFLREPHAFVLGLPLDNCAASPLVVWPESHHDMGNAFRLAVGDRAVGDVDLTETYQATRKQVFATREPVEVRAQPGASILLHRHLLHGMAPWDPSARDARRMVAYFRPQFDDDRIWLAAD